MPGPFRSLIAPPARGIERDEVAVELADGSRIGVRRVRDPRAKRIKLLVNDHGARLTLPLRASLKAGDDFLHQHRDWLALQLARQGEQAIAGLQRGQTPSLPLRGQEVPLHWHAGGFTHVEHDAAGIHLHLPARAGDAAMHRALREFYEAQARTDVGRWLPHYLPDLPRAPRQIRFKRISSLWGSLAPDGSMSLDLALVTGAPAAFEYVLVHELCHLLHANHSPAFWHEVERRFPAWREQRDYFHREGAMLKRRLRLLLG